MIAGAGSVGTAIAEDLGAKGYDVIVLERDQALVDKLVSKAGVRYVTCDACEVASLQKAGTEEVDVMVAATGDDEDNLVISLLAKQEFAVPRVIARVNNSKNQWIFNESWGVDVSVCSLVRLLQFEQGGAGLVEVTLAASSPANGKALAELSFPREATIVAAIREGRLIVPHGDTVLYENDEVLVLVTGDAESAVTQLLIGHS